MRKIGITAMGLLALAAAGAPAAPGDGIAHQQRDLACITMNTERLPLDSRASPLDSVSFSVGSSPVKICYGRPSARGRQIFGGLLPYGELWRTGANEPTMIHTGIALSIAGIRVAPGSYSLYTIPGESEWEIIVNGSTTQWGHERTYNEEVRAQEVGRAKVKPEAMEGSVEVFTIRAVPIADGGATVVLEWERTRINVPIAAAGT